MSDDPAIEPRDEAPHADPGASDWIEVWSFELAPATEPHEVSGLIRLVRCPSRGLASWLTSLTGGALGIIAVRDDEVPLPRRSDSLELRGDGLWAELVCETPFEHWGIALEAFGLRLDAADDDVGERLPVGLDLEWETAGPVVDEPTAGSRRYHQEGIVHGDLLVGPDRLPYTGRSFRQHGWGVATP